MGKNYQINRKVISKLRRFIRSYAYQSEITKLRTKYGIPPNGFFIPDSLDEIDFYHIPKSLNIRLSQTGSDISLAKLLNFTKSSSVWKLKKSGSISFNATVSFDPIDKIKLDISKAMEKFPYKSMPLLFLACMYLFYNDIEKFIHIQQDKTHKIISVFPTFDTARPNVVIRRHPDTTKNDLLDFLEKTPWKEINPRTSKTKNKLLENRHSDPDRLKMHDFINKNGHLSNKKLVRLVMDRFPEKITRPVDEGSVGKIKSLEHNRRQ